VEGCTAAHAEFRFHLLRVEDAALRLGVSPRYLYKHRGLPIFARSGRRLLVSCELLEAYVKNQDVGRTAKGAPPMHGGDEEDASRGAQARQAGSIGVDSGLSSGTERKPAGAQLPRQSGPVFKKPGSPFFYIRFWKNGKKTERSAKTIDEKKARRIYEKEKAKADQDGYGYIGPKENRVRFDDLIELLEREYRLKDRRPGTIRRLKSALPHLRQFFSGRPMVAVTPAVIERYRDRRLSESRTVGPPEARVEKRTSKSAIDVEVSFVRKMFRLAVYQGILSRAPLFPGNLQKLHENARRRKIDPATFEAIRANLPQHLRAPALFLFLTGWREAEMFTLRTSDVSLPEQCIHLRPEHSKNREGRRLPLADPVLHRLIVDTYAQRRLDCEFLFHHEGRPITRSMFRRPWPRACERVGQKGLWLHDLRRTALTHMSQVMSVREAMAFSGHKTEAVFRRYDIVDDGRLIAAAKRYRDFLDAQPRERGVVSIGEASAGGQLGLNLKTNLDKPGT